MLINLVKKTKVPLIKKKNGRSFGFKNKVSIWSLKKKPTIKAGIEATKINFKLEKKYLVSFLKKKSTERKVAACKKTSKVKEGLNLKKYWKRFKWPSEEMGKNSVTPWIIPKMILWRKVIIRIIA